MAAPFVGRVDGIRIGGVAAAVGGVVGLHALAVVGARHGLRHDAVVLTHLDKQSGQAVAHFCVCRNRI